MKNLLGHTVLLALMLGARYIFWKTIGKEDYNYNDEDY